MGSDHALLRVAPSRCADYFAAMLLLGALWVSPTLAQSSVEPPQPLITQPINEANLVVLPGNTRPEAKNPANDRGIVPDSLPLPHLMLQLRRPAARELALDALIGQLHDPHSPNFHRWLESSEVGAQFGPATSDIQTITGWLQERGFAVNTVYPNRIVIDFSGTAGQVRTTFHTEIHNLSVSGVAHIANMTDPQIPAALAPAVVGIVSLNDFKPKTQYMLRPRGEITFGSCLFGTCFGLTPADLATIYNFTPRFAAGNSGQGQTVFLVEDSDLSNSNDWTTFRSTFGLSTYTSASLTTIHPSPPSGSNNCTDPGVGSDSFESTLDAEWASAAAPSAAIVLATCENSSTFGGLIAVENLINGPSPPAIISLSYGECEANNGSAANAAFNAIYEQGVAEGTSIFVSAGDFEASFCQGSSGPSFYGVGVNAYASTPYDVAVGGTDFSDTFSGTNSSYWNPGNTATYGSAKSYIPEIPWNDSCGGQLLTTFLGFSSTFGGASLCNSTEVFPIPLQDVLWTVIGGSGGPSGCATGTPSITGVANGSCAGFPKPSWQSGLLGNPADRVRDLPDVSLFASNGLWDHYYIVCFSDQIACTGDPGNWSGGGGTSFSSPIWAGIQALINQEAGARQGLPNYRYYQLAAQEYGSNGISACNSSNGNSVSRSCIFYDVTLGDNDSPCTSNAFATCYNPSGSQYGVLSTSANAYAPAYKASIGWDFTTGIGSVNVANLVANWSSNGCIKLVDTHDFNADCKSDALWRNTSGAVGMWLMNGATIAQNSAVGSAPTIWSIVGQRDFNGDGKADILWQDTSGDVGMWLMNGTSILQSSGIANVPTVWSVAGTGDFNGDGRGDILWHDTSGDIGIWLMNGTSILQSAGVGNVSPSVWSIAGTGDFNGDGMTDILWIDTSGDVGIWFMNGTQIVQSIGIGKAPPGWSIVGTGDFNGDGYSDILWRDASGDVGIWFMNGTQIVQAVGIGNVPTVWSVADTGDFNGDGMSDILWRDTAGDVGVWLMNGAAILQSAGIGNASASVWTIQGLNAD
jgi:hypothetical protein